jgi:hypothetical protein
VLVTISRYGEPTEWWDALEAAYSSWRQQSVQQ